MHSTASVLAIVGITMAIILVGFLSTGSLWVKYTTRDKIYTLITGKDRRIKGKLYKIKGGKKFSISGVDYLIEPTKQKWMNWPPGFPQIVQEPVPTYFYTEGNADPYDPDNATSLISGKSLRIISDEAMLQSTWNDVRRTAGEKLPGGNKTLIIGIVFAVVFLVMSYMSYSTANTAKKNTQLIMDALGIQTTTTTTVAGNE